MVIRSAEEKDVLSIVELLKLSLGESLMPKSEAFWRWKHVANPFGPSPVLVAEENGELIGVRAFMRWEWQQGDRTYRAVRAVDTATHPKHQGRGIFKTLTLQLLDECRSADVDFVFNTPNEQSKPGYLKMGWQEVGRLPIGFRPFMAPRSPAAQVSDDWDRIDSVLANLRTSHLLLHTPVTGAYLRWRFQFNPNVAYSLLVGSSREPYVLVYRKKVRRAFTEFRVVEFLGAARALPEAMRAMREREPGLGIVSMSALALPDGAFVSLRVGPMVTVRVLTESAPVRTFDAWAPGLGDMELF